MKSKTHLPWLLACLAFASLSLLADGAAVNVLSAPNLLRVGTAENIFVECHSCTANTPAMNFNVNVFNHPSKNIKLQTTMVSLTNENNFQAIANITIPSQTFSRDPNVKQYVYLQAEFPGQTLEKVVLVSFQSGYIFIQTDKTIYTPEGRVHYRMFAVTPGMEPVQRDEASIAIEIETPEGIVIPVEQVSVDSGIHSGIYQLFELVSPGIWKVVAKFQGNPQQKYFAEFEVKEYVLPSFEVKLTSQSSFFQVQSPGLTIDIKATYLFGEDVVGEAYVVFGITEDNKKRGLSSSLQRVQIRKGVGVATLRREHILQTFPEILHLVGKSIYVAVSVLTESGSEMVEAQLRNIQIVTSPYTIHFKNTPQFFKPGMTFDVSIEVLNPDGTPAVGVPLVVDPGEHTGRTGPNGIERVTINTEQSWTQLGITAKTKDTQLSDDKQASTKMKAQPYTTTSGSYLHIDTGVSEQVLDNKMKISFILNRQAQNGITYLILSRGQVVKSGLHKATAQTFSSLIVPITKEMMPSFRIIGYYHTDANEVVADSVWVDVKDSCMGSLRLEPTRAVPSFEPGRIFGLRVTGDPGANVGLVAVDKGVYVLNNKYRLTQKKIWDIVEKYDTGCTPGGGKNAMGVFYDAGLLFETAATGTPYRQALNCPTPPPPIRRKRAVSILDFTTSLRSQYTNSLEQDCCLDGMKITHLSYDCQRRSEYITDGTACVAAFLKCCKAMETARTDMKEDNLQLARSEVDDNSYTDSNQISTRSKFPESWLWIDATLPKNPNPIIKTSFVRNVPLPDSITTWLMTGISLSTTYGICISESLEVIVRKDFFIDLRLPYSAVKGEQVEVKAILHNYTPDRLTVRVELIEVAHICSSASKRGKFRQELPLEPQSTRSVPFIIIPMKKGKYKIVVKAAVKDSALNDGIERELRVVPAGVLIKSPKTVTINPTVNGVGGVQIETINSAIPKSEIAPSTPTSTQISVTGREQVSSLVENAISGNSMGTLITQPGGCGEQNMYRMTLPLISTTYLDKTNQWETVGFEKRNQGLQHILTGYYNELKYRKDDGSFAVYPSSQSSTWLTAYVVKVFSMATRLVAVQNHVICEAVGFLIKTTQRDNGMFVEIGKVYSIAMNGDVGGTDSEASMTAFCTIALQESRTLCPHVNNLEDSIRKAVTYLESRLPTLTYSYAVAMASYALANVNKLNKQILYKFASPELNHWPVNKGHVYTLEATAYALLALVKAEEFEDARPVVRWFNKQGKVDGGYGSTQATIMVYQAVAEYWSSAKEPPYDLNVDILLPGRSKADRFKLNHNNHYATRTSRVDTINQDVIVTGNGSGEATVKMVSLYYALPSEQESDCQRFNLSVKLIPDKLDENEMVYKLHIEVFANDKHEDASMSILDIGLLSGFTPNFDDLNLLSEGRARVISKYEMNTVLSDRGSLILYLDKVSHTRPEEIIFRIHQKIKVGVLQPAAVSVYEYYDQTHCVKFYHPEREAGQLLQLCQDSECVCAEENCSMQKKGEIDNNQRTTMVCETSPSGKIDFVYKVRIEGFHEDLSTDIYTVRVIDVIKEGTLDVGSLDSVRPYLSYAHCRKYLNLVIGKTYLIMGLSIDIHKNEKRRTYQYVLGERTWIEYWPTSDECKTPEYRPTCLGLQQMKDQFLYFGCPQ